MSGFCFDLARLCAYESKRGVNDIQLLQMPGTLIFTQREKLASEALEWGADQTLWIDSDQRFPANALEILQSRQVSMIGTNATTRREPILPTALNLKIEREMLNGKPEGEPYQVWHKVESRNKKGIEQVTAGASVLNHLATCWTPAMRAFLENRLPIATQSESIQAGYRPSFKRVARTGPRTVKRRPAHTHKSKQVAQ